MDNKEILKHVDHTLLKPTCTYEEIKKVCQEAMEYHTASVCIPPYFVKQVHEDYKDLNICTVIGFPLGYNSLKVKLQECKDALESGANEIDMVINQTLVKDKKFDDITSEIKALKELTKDKILKVIIETSNLDESEKIHLCKCVSEANADYIKTSTGFSTSGARLEDIKLFKKYLDPKVKIKAAGGIRTKEDMEAFINEGCDRIGCSAAIKVLKQ